MTDKKRTKKELEEELETAVSNNASLVEQYNTLYTEAMQVQKVAGDRLVSIRLLEAFANEVNAALNKLRSDVAEVNRTNQAEAQAEEEARVAFFGCDRNPQFVEARAAAIIDVVEIDEQRRQRLAAPCDILGVGGAIRVVMWG